MPRQILEPVVCAGVGLTFGPEDTGLVILKRCTSCSDAQKEPLFWTVAAWNDVNGGRHAYKHRLCLTCVAARIAPLQVHSDSNAMTCPNCGIDTTGDYDAVYLSWVPKGVGKLQAESPFCGACAAHFRVWFIAGSEVMEDRSPVIEGHPMPLDTRVSEVLARLGIAPRG